MDPPLREALLLTLNLAVVTSALLLVLGYPFALWLTRTQGWLSTLLRAVINLPLVLPPTVLGYYLLVSMGREGFVTQLTGVQLAFSYPGLLIGSLLYSLPFAVGPYVSAIEGLDKKYEEAARALALGTLQRLRFVVLPLTLSGVVTGTAMSFAHTLGEFGVVLLVGGNIPGETRTAAIYLFDLVQALEYERAGQLAFGLLVTSTLLLIAIQFLAKRLAVRT
ncbi:molybdate ABC transporter permease subunit [Deinococcus peraridilitoris]|uniref:Molybdenum transport system permease n=1 Tax=Deinococcus peraridilitoris (strain DSM 19664 / LMG 22246 / CIP 109416 / KR-200) TaxID=937777 RepID=L0A3L1_DEIPD|nr:molybdate ABC transporter permease subunit [Deinococcus peraridilitoris]AFZ68024.1 molybdate ABC transporter, permease protein [Deinococcus peraridilitoris DSM 19664]